MLEEKTGFSCGNMEENHVDLKGHQSIGYKFAKTIGNSFEIHLPDCSGWLSNLFPDME